MSITWILERHLNPDLHARLKASVESAGCASRDWDDLWLDNWPRIATESTIFHGSLNIAAAIRERAPWRPGAFCDVEAFRCSQWYPSAKPWLVHEQWTTLSVQDFVDHPQPIFDRFGDRVFVRPDSPLKPFSGRVIERDAISLSALDHGFYYEDTSIPIIVAPIRSIGREWRYVVVDGIIAAGSSYVAEGRSASQSDASGEPLRVATAIAETLSAPEIVYVLDICEADDELKLMELNPFSGADLYDCDTDAIVAAVGRVIASRRS